MRNAIVRRLAAPLAIMAITLGPLAPAAACSVCLGDPDSPLVHGAKAGVIVLALVVYSILMLMGSFVAMCIFRVRRLRREGLLDEV